MSRSDRPRDWNATHRPQQRCGPDNLSIALRSVRSCGSGALTLTGLCRLRPAWIIVVGGRLASTFGSLRGRARYRTAIIPHLIGCRLPGLLVRVHARLSIFLLGRTGRGHHDCAADRVTCVVLLDRDRCAVSNHLQNSRYRDHSQNGESDAGPRHRTPVPSNRSDRHCRNPRSVLFRRSKNAGRPLPSNPLELSQAAPGFRPAMPPRQPTPRGPPGRWQVLWRQHPTLPATGNRRETRRSERCRSRPIDLQRNPAPNPRKWSATVAREAPQALAAGRSGRRPRRAQVPVRG